jgi:hypothetical protein
MRRRPEAVLVEGVTRDRERVVDPDGLARDLTRRRPGVPIGWTVNDSPTATTRPCSSPRRDVTAAAIRKVTRPAWVSRVAILVYWWRSP